jgi:hypothetical protein
MTSLHLFNAGCAILPWKRSTCDRFIQESAQSVIDPVFSHVEHRDRLVYAENIRPLQHCERYNWRLMLLC